MQRVYKLQIRLETRIPQKVHAVFLDRSLIDCIAYYNRHNITIPKDLEDALKKTRYQKIFLLAMLPEKYWNKTRNGKPREHTYKEGQELHKAITKVYLKYKQKIIKIPYMPIKERADIIERYIS